MKYKFIVILLLLTACSDRYKSEEVIWYSGDSTANLQIVERKDVQPIQKPINTKYEVVTRYHQTIGVAEVEGAYIQKVENQKGKLLYLGANISKHPDQHLKKEISELEKNKSEFLSKLKKRYKIIKNAKYVSTPQVMYSNKRLYPQLFYRVFFILESGDQAERWYLTKEMRLVERKAVGSDLTGRGYVYPDGPIWSQLQSVLFQDVKDSGEIGNDKISISTQAKQQAKSSDGVFRYDLDDPRFDQVQTFHFASAALKAFKDKFGVELQRNLEIQTHLGYPDKKTAAFYFDYKINFGEGDGKKYKMMMRDPTIVYHEVAHAFIDQVGGLERGSLNEGFADFLACTLLDHPLLGEASFLEGPYTRTLENVLTYEDKNGKLYHDAQIVGGTLWDIREKLGAAKTEELSMKIISRLGPRNELEDFLEILIKVTEQDFAKKEQEQIKDVLRKRKWKI